MSLNSPSFLSGTQIDESSHSRTGGHITGIICFQAVYQKKRKPGITFPERSKRRCNSEFM